MVKQRQKPVRYFNTAIEDEKPSPENKEKPEKNPDLIQFDLTEVKAKPWGRRQEDRKPKFNNKPKPLRNTSTVKGRPKIPEELLKKHSRGPGISINKIKTKTHRQKFRKKEKTIEYANRQAAKAEVLLTEDPGYLEADPGETTTQFTQKLIKDTVDITAATKQFDLKLDFGPYRCRYTKNGRHLVLGGKIGHVAAFDWVTKKLHCEINVMESVHDVCFLHLETMFAVAQKNWVYIYDNQGIELHCVKKLNKVTRMEFLPYHFLLSASSDEGYLSWLDVSIGQMVTQYNTGLGRLSLLTHNPWNGVLCLGHAKGVVSLWSPNSREPLAKLLCHKAPISALHVDPSGMYMATAATNRELKIWDIRQLEGPVQEYKLITAANNLALSQKKMLAVGMGNVVEVYRDCCATTAKKPYLRHRFNFPISNFNFCPFEDVLGVGTSRGFSSLLVPGSGEPHFDALEANPFQTKSQRREAEVKALLEKVQPELITLDPNTVGEVDVPTLRDKVEAKQKLLHLKVPRINYEPRKKMKGKGGSVKMARNKKILQEEAKKEFIKQKKGLIGKEKAENKTKHVLDRFLPKKK